MAIDSSADLLFRIGANSDDAEGNITRFRALLGKNLGDMDAEFGAWASKVFGDLSTVSGALTAVSAVGAAAVVAIGAAALEAGRKYSEFVDEVSRGSRVTGISAENMSRLKFAAEETHVSYDSLVTGLTRFANTIVKANEGSVQQAGAFARLGITQAQVAAGEKDMLPLLETVADRFKAIGSQVQKTAIARDLFSRGGPALVAMLNQGSAGMKELFDEADKLGLVIGTKDVEANERYKATMHTLHAEMEALAVSVGRHVIPFITELGVRMAGTSAMIEHHTAMLKEGKSWLMAWVGTWDAGGKAAAEFRQRIDELAKSLAKFGEEGGAGLDPAPVKEAQTEYSGLADALQKVREATIDTASVDERTRKEYAQITIEIGKAIKKYDELRAAGKLTADDAKDEAAALATLPGVLLSLLNRQAQEVEQKNQQAGEELREQALRQGEQTMAVRVALLDLERQKRLEKMREQRTDTAENLAEESKLYQVELDKIATTETSVLGKAQETLNAKIAALGEQTLEQKRLQFNQAVDADFAALSKDLQQNETIQNLIVSYKQAGLAKIDADAKSAGDAEIARLGEQLQRIERVHETSAEHIAAEYQVDVAKYAAAEERKTLATATGEAQRAQIVAMFAAIRKGLTDKEAADLQQLQNSTGWQGVFGAKFAEGIRGNEALWKEWQTSTNQSAMMVRVTLESLKETGQKTFESLAQGMGGNIAHAIVYEKSIGAAMEAALKSTLESLAAQSMVYAIYSVALGFTDLAMHDYPGAEAAFTAAAIWGSVGAAAAVAGRAVPSGSGGAPGGTGTGPGGAPGVGQYGSQTAAQQADQRGVAAPAGASGPHITVNVQGHLVGWTHIGELTNALTDGVLNSGHTLTATNTMTGKQIQQ